MALSPSAAWLAAAAKSPNEPRVLLEIYDGSTTWRCVNTYCGHSDFAADDEALIQFSPLAEEVDPFTRETQIGSMTIEVADAWIRPIAVNNRIWGQRVTLKLGFYGMAESDYLDIFRGAIDDEPRPRPGGNSVVLDCADAFTVLAREKVVGYWANKHPLEIAEDIIEKSGVPAALIDYDSLDPSGVGHPTFDGVGLDDLDKGGTAAYSGAGDAVFEVEIDASVPSPDTFRWRKDGGGWTAGVNCSTSETTLSDGVKILFAAVDGHTIGDKWTINCTDALDAISHFNMSRGVGGDSVDDQAIRDPVSAHELLDELAQLLNGMWTRNEAGQIKFILFDNSKAAEDHWDDDVISDFEQLPADNLVNKITVMWQQYKSNDFIYRYVQSDTDSQSDYAFPGTSERIVHEKLDTQWLDHTKMQLNVDLAAGATTVVTSSNHVHGLTGCRWPDFPTSSQPDWAKCSAARPGWFRIGSVGGISDNDEIVKVTAMSINTTDDGRFIPINDPVTNTEVLEGPLPNRMTISTMVRGQLGTLDVAHNVGTGSTPMNDMTIPYHMATSRIDRFGVGAPKVEVTAPLSKAYLQYGDLVTLENEQYLAYGIDGITSGDGKWEITLKEVNLFDGEPHCRFILTYAGTSSPAKDHEPLDGTIGGLYGGVQGAIADEPVARPHVAQGMEVTQTAGLVGEVAAGALSNGVVTAQVLGAIAHTFQASKDTYVVADQEGNGVSFYVTALGAGRPDYASSEREIAKVVTGAATIDSIDTSEKPSTAVSGTKLINETTGIVKLDLNQQYGVSLNANASLTMYSED
jgi:hypothetical protein